MMMMTINKNQFNNLFSQNCSLNLNTISLLFFKLINLARNSFQKFNFPFVFCQGKNNELVFFKIKGYGKNLSKNLLFLFFCKSNMKGMYFSKINCRIVLIQKKYNNCLGIISLSNSYKVLFSFLSICSNEYWDMKTFMKRKLSFKFLPNYSSKNRYIYKQLIESRHQILLYRILIGIKSKNYKKCKNKL